MTATAYPTTVTGPQVHLVRESILPTCVAFGMQKDSQLKPYFDQEIQLLVEAGIVQNNAAMFAKKLDIWNPKKVNYHNLTSFSF